MHKTLLLAMVALSMTLAGAASAECRGVVRLVEARSNGDRVYLNVRVHASDRQSTRSVFYNVFGEIRVQSYFGSIMNAPLSHVANTVVEAGEEYADDEIEILVGSFGTPVTQPRVRQFLVTGCHLQ